VKASPGDEVIITGHPERYGWMAELVGKVAKVEAKGNGYLLSGLSWPEGPVWIGAAYLKPAESEAA